MSSTKKGQFVGFGQFSSRSYGPGNTSAEKKVDAATSSPTYTGDNAEIGQQLSRLAKRDATTKTKALQRLESLFDPEPSSALSSVTPVWAYYFPRLALDQDRRVREGFFKAHTVLVKKVKGGLARQLPEILPYWLMGLQDSNKEVMKQAVNAFNSAFPPKKRRQALLHFHSSIIEGLLTTVKSKPADLQESLFLRAEDAVDTWSRVVPQALDGLVFLLNRVSQDPERTTDETKEGEQKNESSKVQEVFETVVGNLSSRVLKRCSNKETSVQLGMHKLLSVVAASAPTSLATIKDRIFPVLKETLMQSNPRLLPSALECAGHIMNAIVPSCDESEILSIFSAVLVCLEANGLEVVDRGILLRLVRALPPRLLSQRIPRAALVAQKKGKKSKKAGGGEGKAAEEYGCVWLFQKMWGSVNSSTAQEAIEPFFLVNFYMLGALTQEEGECAAARRTLVELHVELLRNAVSEQEDGYRSQDLPHVGELLKDLSNLLTRRRQSTNTLAQNALEEVISMLVAPILDSLPSTDAGIAVSLEPTSVHHTKVATDVVSTAVSGQGTKPSVAFPEPINEVLDRLNQTTNRVFEALTAQPSQAQAVLSAYGSFVSRFLPMTQTLPTCPAQGTMKSWLEAAINVQPLTGEAQGVIQALVQVLSTTALQRSEFDLIADIPERVLFSPIRLEGLPLADHSTFLHILCDGLGEAIATVAKHGVDTTEGGQRHAVAAALGESAVVFLQRLERKLEHIKPVEMQQLSSSLAHTLYRIGRVNGSLWQSSSQGVQPWVLSLQELISGLLQSVESQLLKLWLHGSPEERIIARMQSALILSTALVKHTATLSTPANFFELFPLPKEDAAPELALLMAVIPFLAAAWTMSSKARLLPIPQYAALEPIVSGCATALESIHLPLSWRKAIACQVVAWEHKALDVAAEMLLNSNSIEWELWCHAVGELIAGLTTLHADHHFIGKALSQCRVFDATYWQSLRLAAPKGLVPATKWFTLFCTLSSIVSRVGEQRFHAALQELPSAGELCMEFVIAGSDSLVSFVQCGSGVNEDVVEEVLAAATEFLAIFGSSHVAPLLPHSLFRTLQRTPASGGAEPTTTAFPDMFKFWQEVSQEARSVIHAWLKTQHSLFPHQWTHVQQSLAAALPEHYLPIACYIHTLTLACPKQDWPSDMQSFEKKTTQSAPWEHTMARVALPFLLFGDESPFAPQASAITERVLETLAAAVEFQGQIDVLSCLTTLSMLITLPDTAEAGALLDLGEGLSRAAAAVADEKADASPHSEVLKQCMESALASAQADLANVACRVAFQTDSPMLLLPQWFDATRRCFAVNPVMKQEWRQKNSPLAMPHRPGFYDCLLLPVLRLAALFPSAHTLFAPSATGNLDLGGIDTSATASAEEDNPRLPASEAIEAVLQLLLPMAARVQCATIALARVSEDEHLTALTSAWTQRLLSSTVAGGTADAIAFLNAYPKVTNATRSSSEAVFQLLPLLSCASHRLRQQLCEAIALAGDHWSSFISSEVEAEEDRDFEEMKMAASQQPAGDAGETLTEKQRMAMMGIDTDEKAEDAESPSELAGDEVKEDDVAGAPKHKGPWLGEHPPRGAIVVPEELHLPSAMKAALNSAISTIASCGVNLEECAVLLQQLQYSLAVTAAEEGEARDAAAARHGVIVHFSAAQALSASVLGSVQCLLQLLQRWPSSASEEVKDWLSSSGLLSRILDWVFASAMEVVNSKALDITTTSASSALPAKAQQLLPLLCREVSLAAGPVLCNYSFADVLTAVEAGALGDVPATPGHLAAAVTYLAVSTLPARVAVWWAHLAPGMCKRVEQFVVKYLTPRLLRHQLEQIKEGSTELRSGDFDVRGSETTREITASYVMDENTLSVVITLPSSYPLRRARVSCAKRMGLPEDRARRWELQMLALLGGRDGSIIDAIKHWKKNIEKEFEGIEPCPICYSVLHAKAMTAPSVGCRTCKNKFHKPCLYKWFQTSHNSTCPMCRSTFF